MTNAQHVTWYVYAAYYPTGPDWYLAGPFATFSEAEDAMGPQRPPHEGVNKYIVARGCVVRTIY